MFVRELRYTRNSRGKSVEMKLLIFENKVFGRWDTKATHWRWRGQVVRPAACIKEWIIVGPTCRNSLLTISRLITSDFERNDAFSAQEFHMSCKYQEEMSINAMFFLLLKNDFQ
ncbi:hypothetical protein L1887_33330 [Cichorium endivia]|nr:hypothetical protein L1887_33330 [Cichorium endivia]